MSFPFEQFIKEAKEQDKSQEFIDACLAYGKNLSEKELPVIFSLEHLAMQMGIQSDYLRSLIGDGKNNFNFIEEYKYETRSAL